MRKKIVILLFVVLLPMLTYGYEHLGEGIYIQRNSQANQHGPKIAILSVIISGENQEESENYEDVTYKQGVSFGTRSKEIYSKLHGYDFIVATKKIDECYGIKETRPLEAAWTKVALISKTLEDYDWVFWSDADSIILNFDVRLENFIEDQYHIIACSMGTLLFEPRTWVKSDAINTGEVFYKNSPISRYILLQAWKNHTELTPGSFEQRRVNRVIITHEDLHQYIKVYPQKSFNTPPNMFELGDFIVHMYAYHGKELYAAFKEFEEIYGNIVDEAEKQITK